MAKGKKTCPGCNEELGARTLTCPKCNHNFRKKKEEPKKPEPEPIQEEIIEEEIIIAEEEPKEEELEEIPQRRTRTRTYKGDPISVEDICACMSAIKTTSDGNTITLIGPVIIRSGLEPELSFNEMYPKIAVDTVKGSVLVFRGTRDQEIPDIIYEGMAIIE